MGTNSPYFPDNVRSDEEAIQYLGQLITAVKNQTYLTKTGAGPFTLTAAETVGSFIEFSGSTTAVVVNTPTAAAIIAQMKTIDPNAGVGSTTTLTILNDNTSSGAITMTAGDGNVTFVAGPATPAVVAIATRRQYLVKIATASTVTFTVIG
jgi:hypothetical protein